MTVKRSILIVLACIFQLANTQAQEKDAKEFISSLFFDLSIDGSLNQNSKEIESNGLLTIKDVDQHEKNEHFTVLKAASFNENPKIEYEGYQNEFILIERQTDGQKVKEISLILNYMAENKRDYKKQYKAIYRKVKPYFSIIDRDKQVLSFVNQEIIAFSNDIKELPILITLKETLVQIDDPKSSIFSIIVTYQSVIE
ncbi:MAG: hypothetical protein ABFS10_11165 [Bacteroidota bacterium]